MHSEKWEEIAKEKEGHHKIVEKLKEIIGPLENNNYPGYIRFSKELTKKFGIIHKSIKPKVKNGEIEQFKDYVAYRPDLIIRTGPELLKDLVFVEFVNSKEYFSTNTKRPAYASTFLRCLRGMLALEFTMVELGIEPMHRRLYIALLDSFWGIHWEYGCLDKWSQVEIWKLTKVVKLLERMKNDFNV